MSRGFQIIASTMKRWLVALLVVALVLLLVILLFKPKPPAPPGPKPLPNPDATAQGMCYFEGQDVYNKQVYDANGTLVTDSSVPIPCSNCVQYVFHDQDGCIPLGYDRGAAGGVCTAGMLNVTTNWGIPVSKPCPFEKKDASSTS